MCGFKLEIHDESEKVAAKDKTSPLYLTELSKSNMLKDSALQVVRWRSLTMSHYMHCPPLFFASLFSTGAELQAALQKCRVAWHAIQVCERLRHKYKDVNSIWCSLPWASWGVVRDFFTLLAEFDFQWICPPAMEILNCLFRSFGSSLLNELGFKEIRARSKQASNHKISPSTSWHALTTSDVMTSFGRRLAIICVRSCICLCGVGSV